MLLGVKIQACVPGSWGRPSSSQPPLTRQRLSSLYPTFGGNSSVPGEVTEETWDPWPGPESTQILELGCHSEEACRCLPLATELWLRDFCLKGNMAVDESSESFHKEITIIGKRGEVQV